MNLVTRDIGIGEEREAIATRLANGIYADTLMLHLRLRVLPIRLLPQFTDDEQKKILDGFRLGKIRQVRGMAIHGCLNTRTIIVRYNRG